MSMARTFDEWDRTMSRSKPDYTALYNQMKSVCRMRGSDCNVELWWRLSAVTYGLCLDLNPATERDACRVRTTEARQYAERAVAISPRNFNANLWMAITMGQLCLLEDCFEKALTMVAKLAGHLAECISAQPESNYRVMLLESNMHLMLWYGPPEYGQVLRANASLVPASLTRLELSTIERKLRRAAELKPDSLEVYGSLVTTLIFEGKLAEAEKVGATAMTLKRNFRSEERLVEVLGEMLRMVSAKLGATKVA